MKFFTNVAGPAALLAVGVGLIAADVMDQFNKHSSEACNTSDVCEYLDVTDARNYLWEDKHGRGISVAVDAPETPTL